MSALTDQSVTQTDTLDVTYVSDKHKQLAAQLALLHGKVRLARESAGIHAYMASPACLLKDGIIELTKLHLAVNLDKYIAGTDLCGQCMKTSKAYRMTSLLRYPPLKERGIQNITPQVFEADTNPDYLELDAKGNKVPKGPGECQLLTELPAGHPALEYLAARGYDPAKLVAQFRASFCHQERSDLHWRPMPGGFKATPQGRIVFFMDMMGVQAGWQARVLEVERKHARYYLHPYEGQWVAVQQRLKPGSPWVPIPGFENWDPAKYLLAYGSKRNSSLMGLDAAIAFNKDQKRKLCVLVEGPLDAGRIGPPGIAIMGKFFSENQSKLITTNFDDVVFIGDNDEAGKQAKQKVYERLGTAPGIRLLLPDLPRTFKDVGEMTDQQAQEFLSQCLKTLQ